MSLYQDLNHVQIDLSPYEEDVLTDGEMKRWEKRVRGKIKRRSAFYPRIVGTAAALLIAIGITWGSGIVSVADMPYVGALIERTLLLDGSDRDVMLDPYKTSIGATAVNEYGRLTLDEVLIDGGRLLIGSTFEPAEGIRFHYRMHPMPKVWVNGENLAMITGGQSIEVIESKFAIYNEIEMKELPLGESIHIRIEYTHLDYDKPMEQPWVFEFQASSAQLAGESETILLDQEVTLENGQTIYLEKLIATPVSTILYYDWPEGEDHTAFMIVSESGAAITPYESAVDPVQSYNRFPAIDLTKEKYYLAPYDLLADSAPASELQKQAVVINP